MSLHMSPREKIGAIVVAVMIAVVQPAAPAGAQAAPPPIKLSDQHFIATPTATGVKILVDLFPFEARTKREPETTKGRLAEGVARQAVELYLKELDKADRIDIKQADVTLVYIRQRDEYKKPRYASMVEIGKMKADVENGAIKTICAVGTFKF